MNVYTHSFCSLSSTDKNDRSGHARQLRTSRIRLPVSQRRAFLFANLARRFSALFARLTARGVGVCFGAGGAFGGGGGVDALTASMMAPITLSPNNPAFPIGLSSWGWTPAQLASKLHFCYHRSTAPVSFLPTAKIFLARRYCLWRL